MSSSYHNSAEPNQNLGNVLGSKPSVKISWAAKQQESGNAMKSLLGYSGLAWSSNPRSKLLRSAFDKGKNVTKKFSPSPKRHTAEKEKRKSEEKKQNLEGVSTGCQTFKKREMVVYIKKGEIAEVISVDNSFPDELSYQIRYGNDKEVNTTGIHLRPLSKSETRVAQSKITSIVSNASRWQTSNSQYGKQTNY
mmetsp:Transcript_19079/g.23422  ORF Transcript_19079/g.23422 Transcript_19079/m.23422 type:complete len:193 (-) Transcript_19079:219-797(-)